MYVGIAENVFKLEVRCTFWLRDTHRFNGWMSVFRAVEAYCSIPVVHDLSFYCV